MWARPLLRRSFPPRRSLSFSSDPFPRLLSSSSSPPASSPPEDPFCVAIIGSGPSGFYTAKYILQSLSPQKFGPSAPRVEVDIIERLPHPFGLVRYGIAPDHQDAKNVEEEFRRVMDSHPEHDPHGSAAYFGNVRVGRDVSLADLTDLYSAVVLATGAADADRALGVDGEGLDGVVSARRFVGWYNGHPEHVGSDVVARALDGAGRAHAVVVGNGNVALDCARILSKGGSGLAGTDVTAAAGDVLGGGVGTVTVAGRRGHGQGAFTIKELREMTKLDKDGYGMQFVVRDGELDLGATPATAEEMKSANGGRPKTRIEKLLRSVASDGGDGDDGGTRRLHLRFLLSPVRFLPASDDPSRVGSVVFERTALSGPAGSQRATGTGELIEIPADLVVISVGYRANPIPGVPTDSFDTKMGRLRHVANRVEGMPVTYAAGWIGRGASGTVATNIPDARGVAASVVEDYIEGVSAAVPGSARVRLGKILREKGVKVVDWDSYRILEEYEMKMGCQEGRPRVKITSVEEAVRMVRGEEG